jgi:formylglycine-generating enzyme required for sulfatase activity
VAALIAQIQAIPLKPADSPAERPGHLSGGETAGKQSSTSEPLGTADQARTEQQFPPQTVRGAEIAPTVEPSPVATPHTPESAMPTFVAQSRRDETSSPEPATADSTPSEMSDSGSVEIPSWARVRRERSEDESPRIVDSEKRVPAEVANQHPGAGRNDNGLGMQFVWCPGGSFIMGSPPSEIGRNADEGPVRVKLTRGFWIGKFTVTQFEWERVMQTSPWKGKVFATEDKDSPATYVSWDDANKFVERFIRLERKAGRLANDRTYALPSEAQWEYACRAKSTGRYSFGNDDQQLGQFAWFEDNTSRLGVKCAHHVGLKQPNPWRIHDMHGNVWEWCRDIRAVNLPGGNDPVVTTGDNARVCRGGAWISDAVNCRAAVRAAYQPVYRSFNLGFRLIRCSVRAL